RSIWDMFDDLREQEPDLAIILTKHSMEEADFLCDRVAIMDRGKVLCENSPESLKRGLETGERVELEADRAIAPEDREALAAAGVSRPRFSSATAVHFYPPPGEGTGRRAVGRWPWWESRPSASARS